MLTYRNQMLSRLPADELEQIVPRLERVPLKRRMVAYDPLGPITHVYFIESGVISIVSIMRDRTAILSRGLVQLETGGREVLEELMRAAHSVKGAARIVGISAATRVAHAMEDCFVAAQEGRLLLRPQDIDLLLGATDLLAELARCSADGFGAWQQRRGSVAGALVRDLEGLATGESASVGVIASPPASSGT